MLQQFISSWSLFYPTYLAALIMGCSLSLIGVIVVSRNQIFIAAAISQAATLGVAVSFILMINQPILAAILFSIAAALLTNHREKPGGVSQEEITGWVFLLSSSLSILLLAHNVHGLKKIQSLMASNIVGATMTEVYIFLVLFITIVASLSLIWRKLVLFITDPIMASAIGINITTWSLLISGTLGLTTGLSIYTSGMLFTFGCLVLPTQIAKNLCSSTARIFIVAPIVCTLSILAGLMISNSFDLPPGQVVITLMAFLLIPAWSWSRFRRKI